ncbi:hypothetical protein M3697_11670 [Janibacter melonis]|uniref:hypothetical protein n=1 Tax=Janibacter melonis TaxID=262209 RepID=UPI002042DA23|nr:hypothetical protein [Janibacter melonis]MCM3555762.1 hypothetical protein [Janibacter melonis]
MIDALDRLTPFPVLDHGDLLTLVDAHRLWGRGLSATDAHLLGSVLLRPGGVCGPATNAWSPLPATSECPASDVVLDNTLVRKPTDG